VTEDEESPRSSPAWTGDPRSAPPAGGRNAKKAAGGSTSCCYETRDRPGRRRSGSGFADGPSIRGRRPGIKDPPPSDSGRSSSSGPQPGCGAKTELLPAPLWQRRLVPDSDEKHGPPRYVPSIRERRHRSAALGRRPAPTRLRRLRGGAAQLTEGPCGASPYSVVLFDEIEKGPPPDVFNALLQIPRRTGRLHGRPSGRHGQTSANTVIIMDLPTSAPCTWLDAAQRSRLEITGRKVARVRVLDELAHLLPSREFLNRVDDIGPCSSPLGPGRRSKRIVDPGRSTSCRGSAWLKGRDGARS